MWLNKIILKAKTRFSLVYYMVYDVLPTDFYNHLFQHQDYIFFQGSSKQYFSLLLLSMPQHSTGKLKATLSNNAPKAANTPRLSVEWAHSLTLSKTAFRSHSLNQLNILLGKNLALSSSFISSKIWSFCSCSFQSYNAQICCMALLQQISLHKVESFPNLAI